MTHKKGHIPKDLGFGSIIDFGDIELPSFNYNQSSPSTKSNKTKEFSYIRFRQVKNLGQNSLDPEEDYNYAQGRTLLGEYFL